MKTGYIVFAHRISQPTYRLVNQLRDVPADLTLIVLILIIILVIASKAITGRGTPLRGGLPSGHAALAFGCWMAITFITPQHRLLVSTVALIMALLVAQTRLESGVHSFAEVFYGGAVGALVTLAIFQGVS